MYSFLKILTISICISLVLGACSSSVNEPFADKDWISMAMESERFIQKSKYLSDEGELWRVMPDSINSTADKTLYSGTPGIVLFYLEMYNLSKNTNYLEEALHGADYLLGALNDTIYRADEMGLYIGIAGIGFALTEVYKSTKNPYFLKAAKKTVDLLEASASKSENGIHWGSITDIVYGSAGIGLYLHYIADELNYSKADSLSLLVADQLLADAIKSPNGLRWKFMPNYERYMDNFSHGTAGTAYFLSETYQRTKKQKYLNAALQAAELLDSLSNEKGYVPHHFPGGEDLYYLNWCHGPAGTSRLYYSLYQSTINETWLEKMTHTADYLMDEGIHEHQTPGYWNNVGKCCGAAGVAEYFLWMFDITGDENYLEFSETMTKQLIEESSKENNYLKWIHAENRSSPDNVAAQTGLMQGSAGIGLWFLQLHARQNNLNPTIILPDKPIAFKPSENIHTGMKTIVKEYKTKSGLSLMVYEDKSMGSSISKISVVTKGFSARDNTIDFGGTDPIKTVLQSDLDNNGYEELFIITQSVGSGSYGSIYGLSSNKDKSVSTVYIPGIKSEDKQKDGLFEGYMGHDSFSVVDNELINTFPVYQEGDSNANPGGGKATVHYTFSRGESSYILKPSKRSE